MSYPYDTPEPTMYDSMKNDFDHGTFGHYDIGDNDYDQQLYFTVKEIILDAIMQEKQIEVVHHYIDMALQVMYHRGMQRNG